MKIGSIKTVNWEHCIGYALICWLVLYGITFWVGGIIDYYHPEWLERYFYGLLGGF